MPVIGLGLCSFGFSGSSFRLGCFLLLLATTLDRARRAARQGQAPDYQPAFGGRRFLAVFRAGVGRIGFSARSFRLGCSVSIPDASSSAEAVHWWSALPCRHGLAFRGSAFPPAPSDLAAPALFSGALVTRRIAQKCSRCTLADRVRLCVACFAVDGFRAGSRGFLTRIRTRRLLGRLWFVRSQIR